MALGALAGLAAVAAAAPAPDGTARRATVVGVSGTMTGAADFRGTWDQAGFPAARDECTARRANVAYRLAMRGPGPLVEVDFGQPGEDGEPLAIRRVSGPAISLDVTTRATGSVASLPGDYDPAENCGAQSDGFLASGAPPPDGDAEEVSDIPQGLGFSPTLCDIGPARYRMSLKGDELGRLRPSDSSTEYDMGDCGWIHVTELLPSDLGSADGGWDRKRRPFLQGEAGSVVSVTYRLSRVDEAEDLDCPGGDAIIAETCTASQAGTITVRYRLED